MPDICFCPLAKTVKWDRSGAHVEANTSFFCVLLFFLFLNLLHFSFFYCHLYHFYISSGLAEHK